MTSSFSVILNKTLRYWKLRLCCRIALIGTITDLQQPRPFSAAILLHLHVPIMILQSGKL